MSAGIIDIRAIMEAAREEGLLEDVVSITAINQMADGRFELVTSHGLRIIYPPVSKAQAKTSGKPTKDKPEAEA